MRVCNFDGCSKNTSARGLCSGHYAQKIRGTPLRPLKQRRAIQHQWEDGYKTCPGCDVRKGFADFYPKRNSTIGRDSFCKECRRSQTRQYTFGIDQTQFREMLAAQGGGCAICGTTDPGKRNFAVDHDHSCCPGRKSCGRCIRGLLCTPCNTAIGKLRDSPDLLREAAAYLERAAA